MLGAWGKKDDDSGVNRGNGVWRVWIAYVFDGRGGGEGVSAVMIGGYAMMKHMERGTASTTSTTT